MLHTTAIVDMSQMLISRSVMHVVVSIP